MPRVSDELLRREVGRYSGSLHSDLALDLQDARRELAEIQGAVAYAHGRLERYAHGRLEREAACPQPEHMADSLRMLADERAAWIEVAIEHNQQCAQLNPTSKPRHPQQEACSECRTHHPNGWACPKLLAATERELAEALEKIVLLNRFCEAAGAEAYAMENGMESVGQACAFLISDAEAKP